MQSNHWQIIVWANMVIHGLLTAGILVICIIGWQRQRHLGFGVLAAWALASLGWVGAQLPLRMMLTNIMGNNDATTYTLFSQLIATGGLSLLLLAGLSLLVFKQPPAGARRSDAD